MYIYILLANYKMYSSQCETAKRNMLFIHVLPLPAEKKTLFQSLIKRNGELGDYHVISSWNNEIFNASDSGAAFLCSISLHRCCHYCLLYIIRFRVRTGSGRLFNIKVLEIAAYRFIKNSYFLLLINHDLSLSNILTTCV